MRRQYGGRLTIVAAASTWCLVVHLVRFNGSRSDGKNQVRTEGRVTLESATKEQVLTFLELLSIVGVPVPSRVVDGLVEGGGIFELEVDVPN